MSELNMKDFFRDFQKFCLDYEKVLWLDNGKSENKVRCVNAGSETQFQIYLTQESNFFIYPEGFDLYYCDWLFGQCQPLGSWQIEKWEVKPNEIIIHFDGWSTLRFYIER
ncbi:hypothetical protein PSE10A_19370 [Pseudomonas amygdali pv. eriobotryae]|uniref:Uncharacterized protein n=1 Tax=Pseudomonas amygdali pv. eriobotryae TaxID=129137 RepID=A0A9P3ACU1_PSEA0|nr:hypothetical protein [Pseudomonas amygdali]GFZ59426.1 hypothetical protein PSE10A_19370 [Pseudomonas amygdali pv. eriobotryae]